MAVYVQAFTRTNHNFRPALKERVCVVFETSVPDDDEHAEDFQRIMWAALWRQYPIWQCPYSQSRRPPNRREDVRHSFSSPMTDGPTRRV